MKGRIGRGIVLAAFAAFSAYGEGDGLPLGLTAEEHMCADLRADVMAMCPTSSEMTLACCDSDAFRQAVSASCPWVESRSWTGLDDWVVTRSTFLDHCNQVRHRWAYINFDVRAIPMTLGRRAESIRAFIDRIGAREPRIHAPRTIGDASRRLGMHDVIGAFGGPLNESRRTRHELERTLRVNRPLPPVPAGR